MKRLRELGPTLMACAFAALTAGDASATILDAFNAGDTLVDFTFDESQGTQIPDAANSGSLGDSFDEDSDSDDVVTNGSGQLDASGKANDDFGTHFIDIPEIATGRVIGLFDVSWNFQAAFDSGEREDFRLSLMRDSGRSSFVTAEINFQRTSATEVTLFGNAVGSGSDDTDDTILGVSGDLLTLIDVDLDANTLELWYSSDDGLNFTFGGSGDISPTRNVEAVRLAINNDFDGDALLIERFAVSFIPEPTAAATATLALLSLAGRARRR